jgi:sigma-B regulation protein RsbU (phosphoserine phosphatase)
VLCYASFDFRKRQLVMANSGLPYPIRRSDGVSAPVQLPGVPLGSFPGTTYEELTLDLRAGDVYVFCTDGIYEAENRFGHEFGTSRVIEVIERLADKSAQAIVDGIFNAVQTFREGEAVADDMTAVAMRITN